MDQHFDIQPAEATPPELTLEGTEAPPLPEDEPPTVKMEVQEEEGRYDEDELEDIELPDMPVKKAKLKNDDVFAPKVNAVKQEKEKKPRKKRKPPTPEQLERLAEGRKKAYAARALKKKERDELKALEKKVAEKKKSDAKKQLLLELGEEEVEEVVEVPAPKAPRSPKKTIPMKKQQAGITHEDLMMAVAQGVESYDRKRKAEKVKKKERQAVEARENEIKMKVQRVVDPNSFWDQYLK